MLFPKIRRRQNEVNAYFHSTAAYWKEIYEKRGLRPLTYQRRRDIALLWIADIGLPHSARILEVGCGAGVLTAALASAGYAVDAIDTAFAMAEMTRQHVVEAGLATRVTVAGGDVHALGFPNGCFDVVVALGVLPWLHSEALAIAEMHRVLKAGGYLLVTADNESRLDRLLDPISTPPLAPLRRITKAMLPGARMPQPPRAFDSKRHRPAEIDRLLSLFGMEKVRSETLGFWPLTFCGHEILSDAVSVRIDRFLRALAKNKFPGLKTTGSQYIVLSQKPPT
jgi:ubiquinone/menaquinone biosynthesis C-methylase UbiE